MADVQETDQVTTILSVTGTSRSKLQFLANLSQGDEPDANWSVVAEFALGETIEWTRGRVMVDSMDRAPRGSLFAVSIDSKVHTNQTGEWTTLDVPSPGLNAVWAALDNDVFVVGERGTRARIGGSAVTVARDVTLDERLNAVHGTSHRNVIAVGDDGVARSNDGSTWTPLEVPTNYNLLAVLVRSETEAYIGELKVF